MKSFRVFTIRMIYFKIKSGTLLRVCLIFSFTEIARQVKKVTFMLCFGKTIKFYQFVYISQVSVWCNLWRIREIMCLKLFAVYFNKTNNPIVDRISSTFGR